METKVERFKLNIKHVNIISVLKLRQCYYNIHYKVVFGFENILSSYFVKKIFFLKIRTMTFFKIADYNFGKSCDNGYRYLENGKW